MSNLARTRQKVDQDRWVVLPSRVIRNKITLWSVLALLIVSAGPVLDSEQRDSWVSVILAIASLCMACYGAVSYFATTITVTPTVIVLKSVRRTEVIPTSGFVSIEQYRWGRFTVVSRTGESWAPFGPERFVTKRVERAIAELQI